MNYKLLLNIPDIPYIDLDNLEETPLSNIIESSSIEPLRVRIRKIVIENTVIEEEVKNKAEICFGSNPGRYLVPKEFRDFIGNKLGLLYPEVIIQTQKPGSLLTYHVDDILSGYINCAGEHTRRDDFPKDIYDSLIKDPSIVSRFFITLDDHRLGQGILFGNDCLNDWKKGDVIYFDWKRTPHATFNTGFWNRPLVRLTGIRSSKTDIILSKDYGSNNELY